MNAKTTIRKVLFIALWLCIGGGMLTLLLAAISNKNKDRCKDYTISIKGVKKNLFIDEKDVEQLLLRSTQGNIKGMLVVSFNLHEMESQLERNTWINDAELYFDNNDVLHISITEKEPVARIFTVEGNSFYIDSSCNRLPLSEKLSARVPVFTGFPDRKALSAKDSLLLGEIKGTALYIIGNPFWMSQVAQVDITPDRKFEMIPVVGNHTVKLGDGENIGEKFRRLMIFYQQVLSKTGFERYKLIDVQYKGQVVASRYAGDPKIDSVQLRKNVEKLLKQSLEAANDTVIKVMPPIIKLEPDSAIAPDPSLADNRFNNPEKSDPNPSLVKTSPTIRQPADGGQAVKTVKKTNNKKEDKPKPVKAKKETEEMERVPKAVMPKKTTEEQKEGNNE